MMSKRIIQIFIISLLLFSCKKKISKESEVAVSDNERLYVEGFTSCEEVFVKIIQSSNFDTKEIAWDGISIIVDDVTDSSISGKINFVDSGNLSGYAKLDLITFKLYSISPYTGDERILEYDSRLKINIRNTCLSEKIDQTKIKHFDLPFSLKTIHDFGEVSNLKEKDFKKIKDIIVSNEPSNSELSNIYKIDTNRSFDTYVYVVEGDEVFSVLVNIDKEGKVVSSHELHYESPKEQESFILDRNLVASIFKIEENGRKTLVEKLAINENGTISQVINNREKFNPAEFKAPD